MRRRKSNSDNRFLNRWWVISQLWQLNCVEQRFEHKYTLRQPPSVGLTLVRRVNYVLSCKKLLRFGLVWSFQPAADQPANFVDRLRREGVAFIFRHCRSFASRIWKR